MLAYVCGRACVNNVYWRIHMSWKTPKIVEIALGAEINSYACAEAKK
jgi:coenzyme PQQ precursor peptide PqqA